MAKKSPAKKSPSKKAAHSKASPKKMKRAKKEKDPNAPKRALSAFFVFSNEKRAAIAKAHPAWKVGEVAADLGRQWREMNAGAKKKYEDVAAKDKARYDAEMKKYKGKK